MTQGEAPSLGHIGRMEVSLARASRLGCPRRQSQNEGEEEVTRE